MDADTPRALTEEGQPVDPLDRFDRALRRAEAAPPLLRRQHRDEILALAKELLTTPGNVPRLYEHAHRFDTAGVFAGTVWAEIGRLQPALVAGTLRAPSTTTIETLSELRLLAIATGRVASPPCRPESARVFLEKAVALNLEFLVPRLTEEMRAETPVPPHVPALFALLFESLPHADLLHIVVGEIEEIAYQRPIWTHHLRRVIRLAARIPGAEERDDERLAPYVEAILGPTPMSRAFRDPTAYRRALPRADPGAIAVEVEEFAASLRRTGLASGQHAVLMRHLRRHNPLAMGRAMGLDAKGQAELEHHLEFVRALVSVSVHPGTPQTIYGLARLLERGLLSRPEVATGLRRLFDLDLRDDVRSLLSAARGADPSLTENALLVAGTVRVLGQPLGIGQGENPTCQAARGLSIWAQHQPGYLLELIRHAARDGSITMMFEGEALHSGRLLGGLAQRIDPDLDPVSLVLVPHLDRLYDEMMRRTAGRSEDGHKWVNPGLYGRLVPRGFLSVFDRATGRIVHVRDFVRRFYATHHPDYDDGHGLAYPNPVGLAITTNAGDLLGFHAVLVQRVVRDETGAVRVYFYNPNNEGRQDWGQGIIPTVSGHGEEEGESSLPIAHFAARLYAFHFLPAEVGDAYAVPDAEVDKVEAWVRASWGRSYAWDDAVPPTL